MNKKVLAIASAGGHWIQLLRLKNVFDKYDTSYLSTKESFNKMVPGSKFYFVENVTRWNKVGILLSFFKVFKIVREIRPDVIITTGAAPGLLGIISGKLIGAKTLWIDSIANVEKISLSGKIARYFATEALTQWPDLKNESFNFEGNILA